MNVSFALYVCVCVSVCMNSEQNESNRMKSIEMQKDLTRFGHTHRISSLSVRIVCSLGDCNRNKNYIRNHFFSFRSTSTVKQLFHASVFLRCVSVSRNKSECQCAKCAWVSSQHALLIHN